MSVPDPSVTDWVPLYAPQSAALPVDTVLVAGTRIVANKLLTGDAQPAFRFFGDGKHEWGPGGSTAPDTNLYRSGAGVLRTDGQLTVGTNIVANVGSVGGQFFLATDGKMYFGSANDTNLYRSAADTLRTDDSFVVGTTLYVGGTSAYIQYAGGTHLAVSGNLYIAPSSANQIQLSADGRIYWGSASDTNLYRFSAGHLRTDGRMWVGSLSVGNWEQTSVSGLTNYRRIQIFDNASGSAIGWVPVYY